MSPKTIFIEPSDVWLFRDGRPFAPNDRAQAASVFPPTPQTMQGVIRSARLSESGEPFDYKQWSPALVAEIGQPDNFGAVRLRGPLLAHREGTKVQPYFPWPQDVTKLKSGWHMLSPAEERFTTNWNENLRPLLPPKGSEPEKFESGWLSREGLQTYLSGQISSEHIQTNSNLFTREARNGVQLESLPKRPAEGMLYQVEYIRLQTDVGLLLEVDGVNLKDSGLLQLGGEARAGRYSTITETVDLARNERLKETTPLRFKLYLATPAFFQQGWLPRDIDAQTLKGNWCGVHVTLISAALGKPQPIGGRNIAQGDVQRAIRRAVPAGSVYFFETNQSVDDVLRAFDGKCVADSTADAQIGFGLSFIGGW